MNDDMVDGKMDVVITVTFIDMQTGPWGMLTGGQVKMRRGHPRQRRWPFLPAPPFNVSTSTAAGSAPEKLAA
jgi:hypothetical protein